MNYDGHPGLRASEQDADDQTDDQTDGSAQDDGSQNEDDAGQDDQTNDQTGDQQDDSADGEADDNQQDDQLNAQDQQQRRRAIEDRARQTRDDIDPVRLAGETAAATARTLAQESAHREAMAREAAEEREALAGMTEDQRATYLLAKETRNLKAQSARTDLLLRSNGDQVAFGRVLQRSPQFAKFEAEVERRHQSILNTGGFTTRQIILEQLIGERALKGQGVVSQQKQRAQQRVQSQRSGTGGGRGARGDGGTQRTSNGRDSLVSRMERDNPVI